MQQADHVTKIIGLMVDSGSDSILQQQCDELMGVLDFDLKQRAEQTVGTQEKENQNEGSTLKLKPMTEIKRQRQAKLDLD